MALTAATRMMLRISSMNPGVHVWVQDFQVAEEEEEAVMEEEEEGEYTHIYIYII